MPAAALGASARAAAIRRARNVSLIPVDTPRDDGRDVKARLFLTYRLLVHPVILGAGTSFFPALEAPAALRLVETRTFDSGVVYLGYRPAR
jgi:hypothetical protein